MDPDLTSAKAAAKAAFGAIDGVVGFGIGDGAVRIYVRDAATKASLPAELDGVPLDVVVSGPIDAQS